MIHYIVLKATTPFDFFLVYLKKKKTRCNQKNPSHLLSSDFAGHFLSLKENAYQYCGTEEGKNLRSSEDSYGRPLPSHAKLRQSSHIVMQRNRRKKKLETVIQWRIVRLKVSLLSFFRFLLDFLSSYVCWFETCYSDLCVYGFAPERWNCG